MKKCLCSENRERQYKEDRAKVDKEIEEEIEKMTPEEIKAECIALEKARTSIFSIGCICVDKDIDDQC